MTDSEESLISFSKLSISGWALMCTITLGYTDKCVIKFCGFPLRFLFYVDSKEDMCWILHHVIDGFAYQLPFENHEFEFDPLDL